MREASTPRPREPVALTIAGSDSSGGAGIQADLKTFTVLGTYGASVLTALTAQNTRGVQGVMAVPAEFVCRQLSSVLDDLDVRAAKTGMLANAEIIAAVAEVMTHRPAIRLVVDPVMVATSGDLLIAPEAVATLREALLPRADLVTPNLPEAARLTGEPEARTPEEVEAQAHALLALGARAVLVKGGHGTGAEARDLMLGPGYKRWLTAPRIDTRNTHGTGCTLSAAVAAHLARGDDLETAVARAKVFLSAALVAGAKRRIGHGAGPVDHLWQVRALPDATRPG